MTHQSERPLADSQGATNERVPDMAEGTMQRVRDAAAGAQEFAGKLTDQARELGEKAQHAAGSFKPYLETSMQERPMATLAIACALGFVLGALWKK